MKFTHLGWVSIILAILKGMGFIPWPWWVCLLPFELGLLFGAIWMLCELLLCAIETPAQHKLRKLREKYGL